MTNFLPRVFTTPPRFFGNCNIVTRMQHSGESDLRRLSGDWPWLAAETHRALRQLDASLVGRTVAWVQRLEDKSAIQLRVDMTTGLAITQWNKLPYYSGSAFELTAAGTPLQPMRVCLPHMGGFNDLVQMLATEATAGGAINLVLGLQQKEMNNLEADPRWRRFRPEERT